MILYNTISLQKELKEMKKTVLSTASVTYAMKGIRLLSSSKITSKLVKIDSASSSSGCTHGIMINEADFLNAVRILRDHGIPYSLYGDNIVK